MFIYYFYQENDKKNSKSRIFFEENNKKNPKNENKIPCSLGGPRLSPLYINHYSIIWYNKVKIIW